MAFLDGGLQRRGRGGFAAFAACVLGKKIDYEIDMENLALRSAVGRNFLVEAGEADDRLAVIIIVHGLGDCMVQQNIIDSA